jgi:tetratricopeptide (TPR) repeat protein
MSRLADRLMGMDRGARPIGQGWIPGLAPPAVPTRRWRILLGLVILLVMVGVAAVLLARLYGTPPQGAALPVAPRPASTPGTTPAAPPAARPAAPAALAQAREAAGRGELAEANRLFRDAVKTRPGDAEAWNDLGVVRARQGDLAGGVEAFRQALRHAPAHVEASRNLAVALDRRGRHDEAAEQYRRFLAAAAPSHPAVEDVRRRLQELDPYGVGARP